MDNTTPMKAKEYDEKIENTIPFYFEFYRQTIDLVKSLHLEQAKWLDTGCGTGALFDMAIDEFPAFQYVLCDPSDAMIEQAKAKLASKKVVLDFCVCGSQQLANTNEFDVITAIQSHHYLHYEDRVTATQNCYNALKQDGALILFENFAPNSERSKAIVMDRWRRYQNAHGKTDEEVTRHQQRYGNNYFPITLEEHFRLLSNIGYREIEIFWLSYMQAGIYAIK
jgi:tRNA (cmo5U34)-methyltransferase